VYVSGDSALFEAHHVGINPPHGMRIVAKKPALVGPNDRPGRMILQVGHLYKGWSNNEYFESQDAFSWEKKARLEVDAPMVDGVHHIFIDEEADPAERYKAVWVGELTKEEFEEFRAMRPDGWEPRSLLHYVEKGQAACLRGSVSPDGIKWTTLPAPLVVEYADTLNTAYFDRTLNRYVLYTRYWSIGERARSLPSDIRSSWTGTGRRAIGRSESADFRSFPPSELILEASPEMLPSETLYTNCYTTIPGAPDQHLMFPAVWNASIDDTTRIVMAASHNGRIWHWVPEGEVLETGAFERWDGGCVWAQPDLLELPNGDWALPITGHNVPHKYPRGIRRGESGYAVWPKGRMVALEAEGDAEFTLMPVIPPGFTIKINASTRRTGWIKIEVVGSSGRSMDECTPIVGDQHWKRVSWSGNEDIGRDKGQPVTLRIKMYQAELYGLEFE
jgi:hypothetical protein